MISDNSITAIKDSLVTYDVLSSFITLKKNGVNYTCPCPFHHEKSPSFTVSPLKNMYKCFGCGKSGDGITFLMEHEKMSYVEALRWIAEKNNIEIEEIGKSKEFIRPVARLEKVSKKIMEWFENDRKITNNTLLRFGITEAKEYMPQLQQETDVICFNYLREGGLVNIKFRGPKKSFKLAKDAELIFFNLDAIKDEQVAYITEGEIDCMSLYEAGIFNAVSVPNGAAASGNSRLEYLDNCWEYFLNKDKVVLFVDNDKAGQKLLEELARRIGYNKCHIVQYPEGCKDANDILIKLGASQLRQVAESATLYPLHGEVRMDDMYENILNYYEHGYPEGYASNVSHDFDSLLTFYPGQLTIVTGIPGSGKSEFVDWLMASLSKRHEWNWGVCSFECPPDIHVTKLAEKFTNKSFAFRKNVDDRIDAEDFKYAIGMIDRHFHFMNLSIVDVTMEGLIAKAEEFVLRYGINGFLFDPWNCIEAKEEGTNYILQCLNKLIGFLEKYKVHGFLVAHPTKLRKDPNTHKYEIPTLYSISGSAHFFNRTHNGLSIYRDFETNQVDVYVQKVKWSWLGKLGYCSYGFDTMKRMYKPLNDPSGFGASVGTNGLTIQADMF